MVAFKEEFPYLRAESGQLFEFDRRWLRDAITHAATEAGYPSWWLTDHVTESIAFYLRLRNDEEFRRFQSIFPNRALRLESSRLPGNRAALHPKSAAGVSFAF